LAAALDREIPAAGAARRILIVPHFRLITGVAISSPASVQFSASIHASFINRADYWQQNLMRTRRDSGIGR
jgi:hypothetical protein